MIRNQHYLISTVYYTAWCTTVLIPYHYVHSSKKIDVALSAFSGDQTNFINAKVGNIFVTFSKRTLAVLETTKADKHRSDTEE